MGLLGSMALDSTVKIAENGVPQEYIVFHHGVLDPLKVQGAAAEVDSCYQEAASGTWLLRKRSITTGRSHSSSSPKQYSYKDSLIDPWLTSNYLPILSAEIRENLINITIPYTIYDEEASESYSRNHYSVMVRNVFIPSENELRIHWDNNTIKTMSFENFWFRNAGFSGAFHDFFSTTIGYSGSQTASDNYGYRPFIVVRSSLFVQTDGLVVSNTAPVISGSNGALGTFGDMPPTYPYTVTDAQGGTVTVTEQLDGRVIRTYNPVLGGPNTLTFSVDEWRKVLNGGHTLLITAADSAGAISTRQQTFTKSVTSCSFTMTSALSADAMPTRCIVNVQGAFPEGCGFTVEICNNGNDASPTWENITSQALTNQKYFFINKTKTAPQWGVKVRAFLSRGTASGDCYISSIGGNYQ